MFGTTCNICRLTQTCTIVKQENKTKNYPSLSYSHGSVLANFFRLPLIAKHSYKKKGILYLIPCHAVARQRLSTECSVEKGRKRERRCLATATHQRSLLWLEAPIGYHSVRLVLRVLPSASHSPTIGFCVESQCILRWVKENRNITLNKSNQLACLSVYE